MVSTSLILNSRTERSKRHQVARAKARVQRVTCHQEINPLKTLVIKGSMVDRRSHQRKTRTVKSKMVSTWMVLMNSENQQRMEVAVVVESQVVAAVAAADDQEVVVAAAKMARKWTQPEEDMASPPRVSMMLLKVATKPLEQKAKAQARKA